MKKPIALMVTIDVGNTSTSLGVFRKGRLIYHNHVLNRNLPEAINAVSKYKSGPVLPFVISSVVPKISRQIQQLVKSKCPSARLYFVGKNLKPKISVRYDRKKLGPDRLVNAYGMLRSKKLPALIVDFGTAITFDYVSKKGVFEGGMIMPGVEIAVQALHEKTALLPDVRLNEKKSSFLGHNTKEAINSGILNGFAALADGMIGRFQEAYGAKMHVMATGGWALRLAGRMSKIKRSQIDPLYTLKSLYGAGVDEIRD